MKLHKDWDRHSKGDEGEFANRQRGDRISLFLFFKIRNVAKSETEDRLDYCFL
jgi:hypothetical protein